MATVESVKAKLQGLIDRANNITGANAIDLTSAGYILARGYESPRSYDDINDGERLYDTNFASGRFRAVDDTEKPFNEGGTVYLPNGDESVQPLNQWRKSLVKNPDIAKGRTLIIKGADATAVDHRAIGYFPEYNLENKTYTLEFEYFRNFDKRHKFYFANGSFVNENGGVITNGGCDPTMPCLAFELNKANDGTVDYKLYRQSSGFVNDSNIFNRKTIPFERIGENYYRHSLSFSTNLGKATITYIDSNPIEADFADTDGYENEIIASYRGKQITIDGRSGTVGTLTVDSSGYYAISVYYNDGTTGEFTVTGRTIDDTVTALSESGEFKAQIKVVLKGGTKKNVTLYERYGVVNGSVKPLERYWIGDIVPVTYTIYHTVNGEDIKVAAGYIYQPADIGLVFGIGNYDALAEGEYYGVRNLVIYKGDRTKSNGEESATLQEITTDAEMDSILANATNADIGKAFLYVGESTETYKQNSIYVIKEI